MSPYLHTYALLCRKRGETEYGFSPVAQVGKDPKPNHCRVLLWNELVTETQFIAEKLFKKKEREISFYVSINIFTLLGFITISPQNG